MYEKFYNTDIKAIISKANVIFAPVLPSAANHVPSCDLSVEKDHCTKLTSSQWHEIGKRATEYRVASSILDKSCGYMIMNHTKYIATKLLSIAWLKTLINIHT